MTKHVLLTIALATVAIVVLIGCARTTPTPTPTPLPTPTPTVTPMTEAAEGAESTQEQPMAPYYQALEALEAYSATLVMEYDPREGSDQKPFRVVFEEKRVKSNPPRQWVRVRGLSTVDPNNRRNDATYTFIGDETWFTAEEERFYTTRPTGQRRLYLSPDDIIPVTTKLDAHGPYEEKVNGLEVDYYTIADPKDLFGDGPDKPEGAELVQGDVWIAREGNFITRYVIRVDANDLKMRKEPTPGTLTIIYNVIPLKPEEVDIEPPKDAVTLDTARLPGFKPGTFPIPDGAEVETIIQAGDQQLIAVNVADMGLADALAFYEKALTDAGWSEIKDDRQEQKDLFVITTWEKGDDQIILMVRAASGGKGVQIIAQSAPPTRQQ